MLAAARRLGDIRSDAALFPDYFGQTCDIQNTGYKYLNNYELVR